MEKQIRNIPMVALRGMTIMPEMVVHFDVSRAYSIQAIQQVMQGEEQQVFLVAQRELNIEDPDLKDVFEIGTIATIKQVIKLSKNMLRVLVTGEERATLISLEKEEGYLNAQVEVIEEPQAEEEVVDNPRAKNIQELFLEYAMKNGKIPKDVITQVADEKTFLGLVNQIAANVPLDYLNLQDILEETDLNRRYEVLAFKIANEMEVMHLKEEIQGKVKERIDRHQKEFILREQLKVIREELGEDNMLSDAEEFETATKKLKASKEIKEKLMKEIHRFKSAMNSSAENGVIRTYIETMLEMPWDKTGKDNTDIAYAKQVLEDEHYGLEAVKERILEFLAVRSLTKKGESPILCLVGPPGTGKTSIARSLSEALKKPYTRISLGGVRDEAEIRGHRKTYVGAMPGRIVNGLRMAGVKNPLMLLDEIDKMSSDYKGDTASAMLEVLDSEQNHKFRDHYVELPVDLSEVLFIASANSMQDIPGPLLDRMEIIEVSSYTENEKFHIAKDHLLAKQFEKNGVADGKLKITDKALRMVISSYTREAGVRSLERQIGEICRKAARRIYEGDEKMIRVTGTNLEDFLGKPKYRPEKKNKKNEVGIVRGLAWTSVGGVTLEIEVNLMPGKGSVVLTGKLGDVMKESAQTGISYIRSISEDYHIDPEFFQKHDIHIHVPEGAVPKDGPSAGITMATAILSAVTGKPVRADVAMTGEITLRGRVLPIGGLKEKLLAAKNAGMKTVCIPKENEQDLAEISEEIVGDMEIIPVEHMDQVIKAAFV